MCRDRANDYRNDRESHGTVGKAVLDVGLGCNGNTADDDLRVLVNFTSDEGPAELEGVVGHVGVTSVGDFNGIGRRQYPTGSSNINNASTRPRPQMRRSISYVPHACNCEFGGGFRTNPLCAPPAAAAQAFTGSHPRTLCRQAVNELLTLHSRSESRLPILASAEVGAIQVGKPLHGWLEAAVRMIGHTVTARQKTQSLREVPWLSSRQVLNFPAKSIPNAARHDTQGPPGTACRINYVIAQSRTEGNRRLTGACR